MEMDDGGVRETMGRGESRGGEGKKRGNEGKMKGRCRYIKRGMKRSIDRRWEEDNFMEK